MYRYLYFSIKQKSLPEQFSTMQQQQLRILFIHEVSYIKKVVYEYQLFPELLALRGHTVSVVDFDETGDHKYQKRKFSKTGIAEVYLENTPFTKLPVVK